jgi:hypothetical protein
VLSFFAGLEPCLIGMEACPTRGKLTVISCILDAIRKTHDERVKTAVFVDDDDGRPRAAPYPRPPCALVPRIIDPRNGV